MASPVLVLDWIELIELSGILFGAALLIIVLFLKKDKAPQSDRLDELRDALAQQGHPNIGFQYLASRQGRGKTPLFHAPMPSVLTLTERLLYGLSIPALVWLARSALHRNVQRTLTLAFTLILPAASLILVDWMSFEAGLVVLIGSYPLFVALLVIADLLLTQAADRAVTQTDDDRARAKEALGFLYFMPLGWSALLFPLHRFRVLMRARTLRIDLEEGYRVDVDVPS